MISEVLRGVWSRHRNVDMRYVADGRVFCPIWQRDIEIDECASCPWFVEFRDGRDGTPSRWLRCRPPAPPLRIS